MTTKTNNTNPQPIGVDPDQGDFFFWLGEEGLTDMTEDEFFKKVRTLEGEVDDAQG